MSKKNIVYSTNPSFEFEEENDAIETLPNEKQPLKVSLDSKKRKGKSVTLITGFVGSEEDLITLAKELKSKCGVGGSAKNNEILIQGELKDKITDILLKSGFIKTKKM